MCVLVGTSGCGGSTTKASHAPHDNAVASNARTRVVYVRPTTKIGSLKPGYTIDKRLSGGRCPESSRFVSGIAYECTVENGIYGPCWPIGKASKTRKVFCIIRKPWEHRGTEINLSQVLRVLPPTEQSKQRVLWGVELTSGQRCYPLEGALSQYHGATVDFACAGTSARLLGTPSNMQPQWTIPEVLLHSTRYSYSYSSAPLGRIAVAWYGEGAST
jgi:hypothetical protein